MNKDNSTGKLTFENILIFSYSISLFFNAYFFVMWGTYPFQPLSVFCRVFSYIGGFCMIFLCINKNGFNLVFKKKELLPIVMGIAFIISINWLGAEIRHYVNVGHIWLIIQLVFFVKLDNLYKSRIFKCLTMIFAIAVLPSLIYFLLGNFGINLPYSIMYGSSANKTLAGAYYRHYPLGIVIYQSGYLARYCGVFDEPGVVGTLAAILFAALDKKNNKKLSILLLVEGFFSFSMAFYLLVAIYVLIQAIIRGAFKFAIVLVLTVIAFTVFVNTEFNNEYLRKIQSRIDTTSFILVENNRTTDSFDSEYDYFVEKGGYPLLMGNGQGAVESNSHMTASSSYKKLVYNYGIFGFSLMIFVFVLLAKMQNWRRSYLPFVCVFFASIYQRPYVFTMEYLTIFIGALAYMAMQEEPIYLENYYNEENTATQ